jgi:glycosyltransferase involved in cell wall biosynthesis
MENSKMLSDPLPKLSVSNPKPRPVISVIIPAYNEQDFIESTLLSLRNSDYPKEKFEIIVVDNGSTDQTTEIAKQHTDVLLHLPDGNVGAVRNHGAKKAAGDFIAFLDADCEVSQDWLANLELLLTETKDTAFGGTCRSPKNSSWIERYWLLGNGQKKQKDLVGACIGISKPDFFLIGGFREDLTSGEDTDLSNRLRSMNISVIVNKNLTVQHAGNAKTISKFIQRQIWHSENYLRDPRATAKDPTFILCALALLLFLFMIFSIPINMTISVLILFSLLLIIGLFSLKRMIYAKFFTIKPIELLKIYSLDALYVSGRCTGIVISIAKLMKSEKNKT